uniref:Uncharacterized protein n=1 Tax=Mycena chlorophos TaxID=658473 RepID=A0ABQ0LX14_MYCCL|nr:predicted protein [Mycena chlorophos]
MPLAPTDHQTRYCGRLCHLPCPPGFCGDVVAAHSPARRLRTGLLGTVAWGPLRPNPPTYRLYIGQCVSLIPALASSRQHRSTTDEDDQKSLMPSNPGRQSPVASASSAPHCAAAVRGKQRSPRLCDPGVGSSEPSLPAALA